MRWVECVKKKKNAWLFKIRNKREGGGLRGAMLFTSSEDVSGYNEASP